MRCFAGAAYRDISHGNNRQVEPDRRQYSRIKQQVTERNDGMVKQGKGQEHGPLKFPV
jgi:hypothetical protein